MTDAMTDNLIRAALANGASLMMTKVSYETTLNAGEDGTYFVSDYNPHNRHRTTQLFYTLEDAIAKFVEIVDARFGDK